MFFSISIEWEITIAEPVSVSLFLIYWLENFLYSSSPKEKYSSKPRKSIFSKKDIVKPNPTFDFVPLDRRLTGFS